jgi:hypothetical protein
MSARRLVSRLAVAVGFVMAFSSAPAQAASHTPLISSFGSFSDVQGVAIDQSTGDVYVLDTDAGGGSLLKFDSEGNPLKFNGLLLGLGGGGGSENEIAVDNSSGPAKGDIYVAVGSSNGAKIDIFSSDGELLGTLNEATAPWGETCGVAVDPSGNLYVGVFGGDIDKFVPAANPVTNADYASSIKGASEPCNLAVDSAGNVFAARYASGPVTRYEPTLFGALSAAGSIVDSAGSTLAVDPANDHLYVDERDQVSEYGAHGEPFEQPLRTFAKTGEGAISESFGVDVNQTSGDVYVSDGTGQIDIFGPASSAAIPPKIVEESAADVAASSATFQAQVNPEGTATTYRFEYGTSESYGTEIPVPDSAVGAGEIAVPVQGHPQNLQPHTTYHFRVVASNAGGHVAGVDQTFTTQTAGGELTLLDERAWEMVSPPNKEGALLDGITFEGSPVQASTEGDAMAYAAEAPTEANPESSRSPEDLELLGRRGPNGWTSKDIAPPHDSIASLRVGQGQEYRFFSTDLSQGIVEPRGQTLLSPQATEQTIYLRDDAVGNFTPLVTAANVPAGVKLGGELGSALEFQGASPDLSHVVLESPVAIDLDLDGTRPLRVGGGAATARQHPARRQPGGSAGAGRAIS